jgi:hypothetical protein
MANRIGNFRDQVNDLSGNVVDITIVGVNEKISGRVAEVLDEFLILMPLQPEGLPMFVRTDVIVAFALHTDTGNEESCSR